MNINDRIKELRNQTGLNQEDFAASIGLKRANYAQMEIGNQKPVLETLAEIVRIYNKGFPHVTYEWLIEGKKPPKPAVDGQVRGIAAPLKEPGTTYKLGTGKASEEIAWRDKYIDLLERKIQENAKSYVLQESFEGVASKVDALQELVLEKLGQVPGTSFEEVSAQLHIKTNAVKKSKKKGILRDTST